LAVVKKLQPKCAFLVGMTHEFEHELDNKILAEWSLRYPYPIHKHCYQSTAAILVSTSEMAMEGPVLFEGIAKDSLAFRLMTQMVSIFA
jgi:hypothetical protein